MICYLLHADFVDTTVLGIGRRIHITLIALGMALAAKSRDLKNCQTRLINELNFLMKLENVIVCIF